MPQPVLTPAGTEGTGEPRRRAAAVLAAVLLLSGAAVPPPAGAVTTSHAPAYEVVTTVRWTTVEVTGSDLHRRWMLVPLTRAILVRRGPAR